MVPDAVESEYLFIKDQKSAGHQHTHTHKFCKGMMGGVWYVMYTFNKIGSRVSRVQWMIEGVELNNFTLLVYFSLDVYFM